MNRAKAIPLPALVSVQGQRSANQTVVVTGQFDVEKDPRYAPGDGKTWCNIFTWDWSCAMGARIPHWITSPTTGAEIELNANALTFWLSAAGFDQGWREVRSSGSVLAEVNNGNVCVATFHNPAGHGHITPIVPDPKEIMVCNVGAKNFQRGPIAKAYGRHMPNVRYWVHP